MLIRQIFDPHLNHYTYLVGCQKTGGAILIDPERDIDRYRAIASEVGPRTTTDVATHIHAGTGKAIICVTLTTICGTDLNIVRGEYPVKPGLVIGHKPVGVIVELGPGVVGYQIGDRVHVEAPFHPQNTMTGTCYLDLPTRQERFNAGAICVGSHTRPGLRVKVLGSVSLGVLQQSRHPVLVV